MQPNSSIEKTSSGKPVTASSVKHQTPENVAKAEEQFNIHQEDLKGRVNFLAQAIFVLAAGCLSASIAVFTGSKSIFLNAQLAAWLKLSWWSLVGSVSALTIMLSAIIFRDYFFAERWRRVLGGANEDLSNSPGVVEFIIIILGLAGIAAFIFGFVGITYVATGILGIA